MSEITEALQGSGLPITIASILAAVFIILQLIGEIIEAAGKSAPMLLKLRKVIAEHKEHKKARLEQYKRVEETLAELTNQQAEVKQFLANVKKHYDDDNIAKRDAWMLEVNSTMHWARERAEIYDASVTELNRVAEKVDRQSDNLELNNRMTSELYKQFTRTDILNFAHRIINARKAEKPVIFSREEFTKIRKSYDAYEQFLETFGGVNGEVDDAMEVIKEAQQGKISNILFVEDMRD